MERWMNKVAVVTGASSGIGNACARALLDKGMIVVGLQRRQTYMENEFKPSLPVEQRERFYSLRCDLCIEDDIRSSFAWIDEHLGGVHVLINNAGVGQHNVQIISENNTETLRRNMDVNVMAVALCSRETFQIMKRRNIDGHIVFMNCVLGHRVPNSHGVSFNIVPSTKYAMTAMVEVLRQEFWQQQTKIKVTSLSPSITQTAIIGDISEWPMELPVLQPSDVADALIFCLQTPPNVQIRELAIEPLGQQF